MTEIYEKVIDKLETKSGGFLTHKGMVEVCELWLKRNAKPSKLFNDDSHSYRLKHVIERGVGRYISMDAAITAAMNLGYDLRPVGETVCGSEIEDPECKFSRNVIFKMKLPKEITT